MNAWLVLLLLPQSIDVFYLKLSQMNDVISVARQYSLSQNSINALTVHQFVDININIDSIIQ